MNIVKNYLSPKHYSKTAQLYLVPEQLISESVEMYKDAIDYVKCEIQSTIQHESGHRGDEEQRNQEIINRVRAGLYRPDDLWRAAQLTFDQFSQESRVEPIAEREEIRCTPPVEISGETESVNLQDLFNQAKNAANIDPSYKQDVKAGTLSPEAQGMYLMQDMSNGMAAQPTTNPNQYRGFDGSLWVDVRKIAEPYIARQAKPPTFQDDGTERDRPGVSQQQPTPSSVVQPSQGVVPSTPAAPAVQGRESR